MMFVEYTEKFNNLPFQVLKAMSIVDGMVQVEAVLNFPLGRCEEKKQRQ